MGAHEGNLSSCLGTLLLAAWSLPWTFLPGLKVVVSFLVQSTRYTIHGSDFQRASTPPSLETGDFVRCVPLDRQKSMPAQSLVILETSALVSQPGRHVFSIPVSEILPFSATPNFPT